MIISQTPFRISFFGGGTDYPKWFKEHGGAVLSASIDKYCYLSCRPLPPFFQHRYRIVYSRVETVKEISEIEHPSVRAVLSYMGVNSGLEIHHDGDLPARSGVGSSSSFTVGLINALHALNGRLVSKHQLACEAIHVEQDLLKESVGCQDQVAAAIGGFNRIRFHRDSRFDVEPIVLNYERREELSNSLLLFFTGQHRIASEIAQSQIRNIEEKSRELRRMYHFVDEAVGILGNSKIPIDEFGKLMAESWQLKRGLSPLITNAGVDNIYDEAIRSGAVGGKLLGAGGGGFMLLFVPPQFQTAVREKLKSLIEVRFSFENQGSRITLYNPEEFKTVRGFAPHKPAHSLSEHPYQ